MTNKFSEGPVDASNGPPTEPKLWDPNCGTDPTLVVVTDPKAGTEPKAVVVVDPNENPGVELKASVELTVDVGPKGLEAPKGVDEPN